MKAIADAVRALKSGDGLRGQLLRAGIGSIGIKIGSTGLNLAVAAALARFLGAEEFGVYSFIFALVSILAIPAQMGLPNLVVRETAKAHKADRWEMIKGLWRWSSLIAGSMSLALIAAASACAFIFAGYFTRVQLSTFAWALALIPLVALGNLRGAALRGLRYVVQGQLPEFILRPFFLIVLTNGFWLWQPINFDAADAMMLHFCAAAAAFAVGAMLLFSVSSAKTRRCGFAEYDQRNWLRAMLPLAAFTGIYIININLGQVAVGLLSNQQEVGFLRIAQQGATLISFTMAATNMIIAPHVARLFLDGAQKPLQTLLTYNARINFLFSCFVFFTYLLFGKSILSYIFGEDFIHAYALLLVLSIGQMCNSFASSNDVLLNMTGHERSATKGVFWGTLTNVAVSVLLVPSMGALGAAIASSLSLVVWNAYLWLQSRKILKLDCSFLGLSQNL